MEEILFLSLATATLVQAEIDEKVRESGEERHRKVKSREYLVCKIEKIYLTNKRERLILFPAIGSKTP
jgi:hypothetical protein